MTILDSMKLNLKERKEDKELYKKEYKDAYSKAKSKYNAEKKEKIIEKARLDAEAKAKRNQKITFSNGLETMAKAFVVGLKEIFKQLEIMTRPVPAKKRKKNKFKSKDKKEKDPFKYEIGDLV